ncbi:hypothetical protein O6H91_19G073300 [Diphasiastrum complanatum]|uniref:Uncharacterized protein n=1 Tax=Diphasiastrum complanatum TaxID=34168 RepID=A0ACC2AWQ8_DIPCM|nr:hypothetical protein O6H91_Y278500 [Diphasiastrum complanatum]KAJ7521895.1 hypothetical protein O6H91_19G073300 [Diphasiastrum complanatum]
MESRASTGDSFWVYSVPLLFKQGRASLVEIEQDGWKSSCMLLGSLAMIFVSAMLAWWFSPGGCAWSKVQGKRTILGPRGWPVIGSLMDMGTLAHRRLAELSKIYEAQSLMALSLGNTRVIISSKPDVAREILNSSCFADRPLKQSAQQLLFGRAIGFAPQGDYWRGLRRVAANHLFTPKRIAADEPSRQREVNLMLQSVAKHAGVVEIRPYLQRASLNNIMSSVFGRRFELDNSECGEAEKLQAMVREGFELLGAFNWADHLPTLQLFDPQRIHQRCAKLVPRVNAYVQQIIDEHRQCSKAHSNKTDFVDVLLSLQGEDKLKDDDMVAVLWEMIFRGTDTTAILTEWIMAELVLHPDIQAKAQQEIDAVVGSRTMVEDADIVRMPYLQAIVKETLRMHPPGPLLSWARLSTEDLTIAGHHIPKGTTAMVNMWSITHDPSIWANPEAFLPERFFQVGNDIDPRGGDLRLAPFGAGRRVCPGRALALATVHLWLARLLHHYTWLPCEQHPVDLTEVLRLSCEMANPLKTQPILRAPLPAF